MKAVKANKEYTIDESQKTRYQNSGFDIYDNEGNIVAYSRGKTVPYEKYAEVTAENDLLKRLEVMSAEELTALAAEKGIDIGQATTQETILKKIKVGLFGE